MVNKVVLTDDASNLSPRVMNKLKTVFALKNHTHPGGGGGGGTGDIDGGDPYGTNSDIIDGGTP